MQKQQAVKPIVRVPLEEQGIEETANVLFKPNHGPQTDFLAAGEREVLYGGSVSEKNAKQFFSEEFVDGALIGGASLDGASFAKIVNIKNGMK